MAGRADHNAAVRRGDKRAVAALISRIESGAMAEIGACLDDLHENPRACVLGVTGPPGVGKSTLIRELIKNWRSQDAAIGVLAIDPSSRVSGGALLGDRLRMASDGSDTEVFIRSMAAGDQLGGLACAAFPAVTVMRAAFDHVIVETVGVGQSETGISDLADTVLLCAQPGAGDVVQFMKAGIMEVPDVVTVTKTDMGISAERTLSELRGALGLMGPRNGWTIPIAGSTAAAPGGLGELATALERHAEWLSGEGRLTRRRVAQAASWMRGRLMDRYGRAGLGWLQRERPDAFENIRRPFSRAMEFERLLHDQSGFE